ncbi:Ubiquitin carboxyl-terminal hydrolase 36 [Cichlidogyrus casuarinus]|uniref:Ubiquitin carboxyl-terminal hydrolase n=1 Tax=Cichlidogyrus casuarinus TaxID=1844966 RepID=A0ABD2QBA3_9PLAT
MMSSYTNSFPNLLFPANNCKISQSDLIKNSKSQKFELDFNVSTSIPFEKDILTKLETEFDATILKHKPTSDINRSSNLCQDSELNDYISQASSAIPPRSIGLTNCGNTCYLNSCLQCLIATGPLLALIKSSHSDSSKCVIFNRNNCTTRESFCALCGVNSLLREHTKTGNSCFSSFPNAITPEYFSKNVKDHRLHFNKFYIPILAVCPSLRMYMQEDAHEFLLGMLSKMEDATLLTLYRNRLPPKPIHKIPPKIAMTNAIRRIFGGQSKYEIKCHACQHVSSREEHWFNLSLDILNARTLQQCLSNLIRPETLSGANAYKCPNCKQLRPAERRCRIKSVPLTLIIQFNRFSRSQKLDSFVEFPETFNLRNFMEPQTGPPVVYRLYALVNHQGLSCRSGHYVAFSKRHGRWYLHNDSSVSQVNQQSVMNQHPYLLFYQLESKLPTSTNPPQVSHHSIQFPDH